MKDKDLKIQDSISGKQKSKIRKYMELVIGSSKYTDLIKYELIVLLTARMPGAVGLALRSKLYPKLLGSVGQGVVFGPNITLRHPGKIHIKDNVIIDESVMLDAKGIDNTGISLGNDVFVGRNSILSCKNGSITLGDRTNIGYNCCIASSNNVAIGDDVLVAAYTYISGGGNYKLDDKSKPINTQYDFVGKGGVRIKDNVWIGTHAVILDGVTIDSGSVLAAGSIVTKNVDGMTIVGGIPARPIATRT